jgi:hypothetical protein
MGLQMHGFPNLLTILGPQNGGTYCNIPRCIEQNVEFITALLGYMRARGFDRVEATAEAECKWTQEALDLARPLVAMNYDNYMNSVNSQFGTQKREMLVHAGGQAQFRRFCEEIVADGYRGFSLSNAQRPDAPNRKSADAI